MKFEVVALTKTNPRAAIVDMVPAAVMVDDEVVRVELETHAVPDEV